MDGMIMVSNTTIAMDMEGIMVNIIHIFIVILIDMVDIRIEDIGMDIGIILDFRLS